MTSRPLILSLFAAAALAQTTQPQDPEYAKLVKEWTTRPEFMSQLVDHLPKAAGIPTTKDVLGYYVGAPKKLTHVADLGRYYRALAAASKRVKLFPAGTTDEGRECLNEVAVLPAAVPRLTASGGFKLNGDARALLVKIARDAIELFGGPGRGRIRTCEGEGCALLFLDLSRSGGRRWCSMSGCGNRAKARAFRERGRGD